MTVKKHIKNYHVYVIAESQDNSAAIKIGMTGNFDKRISQMQTSAPYRLQHLGSWCCKSKDEALKLERSTHKALSNYRLSGEWFSSEALDELPKFDLTGEGRSASKMIDPVAVAHRGLSGREYDVLLLMSASTANLGFVDITQEQLASDLSITRGSVSRYISNLKKKRLIFKERNKKGRMKYRINPEYLWDYRLSIRNDLVADIRVAKMNRKTREGSAA